jgi:hypothetical protein
MGALPPMFPFTFGIFNAGMKQGHCVSSVGLALWFLIGG